MTSTTQHYGLTKLGPGEGVHAGSDRFASDDRDTIDQALYNAVMHHHTGAASSGPSVALDLVANTTGGTIPAATTVRYKYTYTDPSTGESLASPEATIATPDPLDPPVAPTFTLQSIGGTLEPGQYFYVLTAYVGSSTVETKALNPVSVVIPAGTSTNEVTLDLPALDVDADGFNVYRRAPNEARYYFLESTSGTEYIDGGVAATTRSIPTANTTFATNSITVSIPGATPAIPAGNQWSIYRSYSADYTNSFLVQLTDAELTYLDVGDGTAAGSPPSVALGAPEQVDLTTEVQAELPVANGGTGAATAAAARTNLGLGTMATQNAATVAITGGTVTGITDLAVADGGTGASTAATARTNLGLGTIATQSAATVAITGGSITGITDLAVADGGTGASTAANARTNLGLGTIATQSAATVAITGGSITGITDLAIADGGTGASTAAAALTNLGAVAKSGSWELNAQAQDKTLNAYTADAETTAYGTTLTDPADAPVDADALREDLVANSFPQLRQAMSDLNTLRAAYENLRLAHEDLRGVVAALVAAVDNGT